jgi:hypothetical protein
LVDKPEPVDPFDPERLRVTSFEDLGLTHQLLAIGVRKPDRQEFFRVNPDPAYSIETIVFERKADMRPEIYLVDPELRFELLDELRPARLFTCMNRQSVTFLWPCKLPVEGSAGRRWSETALVCAEEAKHAWIRMIGNRHSGAYETWKAKSELGDPQWLDRPFAELLKLAFGADGMIDRIDHPALRELRGEL